MEKETVTPVQEAQRVWSRINPRRDMPRHIGIKLTNIKDKEKILKATREKQQITYKGTLIKLSANFSIETLQAKREWHDISQVMKLKKQEDYPARFSFRFDREMVEKTKALQTSKSYENSASPD